MAKLPYVSLFPISGPQCDAEADGEDGHVVRHGRATDDEGSEALMLRNYVAKPNRREVDEGKVETFKRI